MSARITRLLPLALLGALLLGSQPALAQTSFKAGDLSVQVNAMGRITALTGPDGENYLATDPATSRRYTPALLKLIITDTAAAAASTAQQLLPTSATRNSAGVYTLSYAHGITASVTLVQASDYATLELTGLTNPSSKDIRVAMWGPYVTTIDEQVADVVGVTYNRDFAIGIQAANQKTLGGAPGEFINSSYVSPFDYSNDVSYIFRTAVNKNLYGIGHYFISAATLASFGSVLQAYSRDYSKDRTMKVANQIIPRTEGFIPGITDPAHYLYSLRGLTGSKIALFGVRRQEIERTGLTYRDALRREILEVIHRIELAEGLPYTTGNGGQWAKFAEDSKQIPVSYSKFGNIGQLAQNLLQSGSRSLYVWEDPAAVFTHPGLSYPVKPRYGSTLADIRGWTKPITNKGVVWGFHILPVFAFYHTSRHQALPEGDRPLEAAISTRARDLGAIARSTLASAVGKDDTSMMLTTHTSNFNVWAEKRKYRYLLINDELIRYSESNIARGTDGWELDGVVRGAFHTPTAAYEEGTLVRLPANNHGYSAFSWGENALAEVGQALGNVINNADIAFLSMDGIEGTYQNPYSLLSMNTFYKATFDNMDSKRFNSEGSLMSNYNWHFHSRFMWGEAAAQTIHAGGTYDYQWANNVMYQRNFYPAHLGGFFADSNSVTDFGWIGSKVAAFDAGVLIRANTNRSINTDYFTSEKRQVLGRWVAAARSGAFSDYQRARLTPWESMFALDEVEAGRHWRLWDRAMTLNFKSDSHNRPETEKDDGGNVTTPGVKYGAKTNPVYVAPPWAGYPTRNVAGDARVSASSKRSQGHQPSNVVDGHIGIYKPLIYTEGNKGVSEWAAAAGDSQPWIQLTWDAPQYIRAIFLSDRGNPRVNVTGYTIAFSDGHTITGTNLPIRGQYEEVRFPERTSTSLKVTISAHTGTPPGLSEIVVIARDPAFQGHLTDNASVVAGFTGSDAGKLFDGNINSRYPNFVNIGAGLKSIVIKLDDDYMVDGLTVWRYNLGDPRSYRDVVYQLSTQADFSSDVTTVFNNDGNNSAQQETGTDVEFQETSDGHEVFFPPVRARYLRLWSNGNSVNTSNHYTEVEVYGMKNLAHGRTPTQVGGYGGNSGRATDGDPTGEAWHVGPDFRHAQLDLGSSQRVDSLRVWRPHPDERRYHDVIYQLSDDAAFSRGVTTVFNNDRDNSAGKDKGGGTLGDGEYSERASGQIVNFPPVNARYVRLYSRGNTQNTGNHYAEIMVGQSGQDLSMVRIEAPEIVLAGAAVTLDGSASTGNSLSYEWSQVRTGAYADTPAVTLTDADSARAGFTAPAGLEEDLRLRFQFIVTDRRGISFSATVDVLVAVAVSTLSIAPVAGGAVVEEGNAAVFTVTRAGTAGWARLRRRGHLPERCVGVAVTETVASGGTRLSGTPPQVCFARGITTTELPLRVATQATAGSTPASEVTAALKAGAGYRLGAASSARVYVTDNTPGLTLLAPGAVTESSRPAVPVSVVLHTRPAGNVSVTLSYSQTPDGGVATDVPALATVTFTPQDWHTPQAYRYQAEDADALNMMVTFTATAASTDTNYDGLTATHTLTLTDDDTPALSVAPATAIEGTGQTLDFVVRLGAPSSRAITVNWATQAGTATAGSDYHAASDTLTFPARSTAAQTIRVTLLDDTTPESDETVTLVLSNPVHASLGAAGVAAGTILDDDGPPGLVLAPPGPWAVAEGGTFGYRLRLASRPPQISPNVTVTTVGHQGTDVTPDKTVLRFTAADWHAAQTVTLGAAEDTDATDDVLKLVFFVTGGGYVPPPRTVTLTVRDNDAPPQLAVADAQALEDAGALQLSVRLSRASTQTVTVDWASADGSARAGVDYTASRGTLTFDAGQTGHTVSVPLAPDDDTPEVLVKTFEVVLSNAANATLGDARATGRIIDNDRLTPGVRVQLPGQAPVAAATATATEGAALTYAVFLTAPPAGADVTLTARARRGADATVTLTTLRFSAANWYLPQSLTYTVPEDVDAVHDTLTLTHVATGAANYPAASSVSATLVVAVTDNDEVGLRLADSLSLTEGGRSQYKVALTTQPTGDVTLAITGHEGTDVTPDKTALRFTAADWHVAQTVTVSTAADDADVLDETVTLTHSASGGDYADVSGTLRVVVIDDETPRLVLGGDTLRDSSLNEDSRGAPTQVSATLSLPEGQRRTHTLALWAPPAGDVTVTPDAPPGVTVSPSPLTFTTTNWHAAQTLTLTAQEDDTDVLDETVTLRYGAAGGQYDDALPTALTVRVTDNDRPRLVLGGDALQDISLNEDSQGVPTQLSATLALPEGQSRSFTLALWAEPPTVVTVRLLPEPAALPGWLSVQQDPRIFFDPRNRDRTWTLTLAAAEDDTNAQDETLLLSFAGGLYPVPSIFIYDLLPTALALTVIDNDTPALAVRGPPRLTEGETARFSVTLDIPSSKTVTVDYAVASVGADTASAPADYRAASGTLSFPPNGTAQTLSVPIVDDTLAEGAETFTLTLRNPVHATLEGDAATLTARATIEDNEALTLAVADAPTQAEGNTLAFPLTLAGGTGSADVVVTYTLGGTATAGDDYSAPPGALTFAPGATAQTITVPVTDDTLAEGAETLTLTLTDATTDKGTVSVHATDNAARATIADNEALTVAVADAPTQAEGATLTFPLTLAGGTGSADVVVTYTLGGTATAGDDYSAPAGALTFAPGATAQTITVPVTDDTLAEGAETLVLTLDGARTAKGTVRVDENNKTASATITDNDTLTVTLGTPTPATVAEGNTLTFPLTLAGGTGSADVVVTYTLGGSATAADYTKPPGTLTLTPGASAGSITVRTADDTLAEGDETLTLTLTDATTDKGTVSVHATDNAARATLTDNEALTVAVADAPTQAEGATLTFPLTLAGGTGSADVVVTYTLGGSATAGDDYSAPAGALTFAPGATAQTITVPVTDDTLAEGAETLVLTLDGARTAKGTVRVDENNKTASATITDNDTLTVTLGTPTPATVAEGNTLTFPLTLAGGTGSADVVVTYTLGGSATAADYTKPPGTLTLTPGASAGSITVRTADDTLAEGDETLTLTLTDATTDKGTVSVHATDNAARATIADNEALTVAVADAPTQTEGNTLTFPLTLAGGTGSADVVVTYTLGGSATAADYTKPPGTLTLTPGASAGSITVRTTDDTLAEGDETLTLTLTDATTDKGTVSVHATDNAARATIADNEALTVAVADAPTQAEGATLTFPLTLAGGTGSADVVVTYTLGGSATAADYTKPPGTLTLTPGATSTDISIPTTDDTLAEGAETLVLTLTGAVTTRGTVRVDENNKTASATITDNDALTVALGVPTGAPEGGTVSFPIRLDGGSGSADVTVTYTVSGTATGGEDYSAPAGALTFAPGATAQTITVPVTDDTLAEGAETLVLTLTGAVTTRGTVRVDATNNSATATITDNDALTVALGVPTGAPEGGTVSFPIRLDGGSGSADVTVTYTVSGTATGGEDYSAPAGALTFVPGATAQTITVPVTDDTLAEGAETLVLTLTGARTAKGTVRVDATNNSATATITDNDALTVALGTPTPATVTEGGTVSFPVQLAGGAGSADITVTYSLGGSATAGDDYTAPPGALTLGAGESEGAIGITTRVDAQLDEEILTLTLAAAATAKGTVSIDPSRNSVTVTLVDADNPPAFDGAGNTARTVAENQTAVTTLAATDPDGDAVTGYALSGGADRTQFEIDAPTNGLRFRAAPNFEQPADAGRKNMYAVEVTVSSGAGARARSTAQALTVTVTDVDGEAPAAPDAPAVAAVPGSSTSLRATWAPPVNTGPPVTDYDVRYRGRTYPPGGAWTEVTDGNDLRATEVTFEVLHFVRTYEVQVRATNAEGTGPWSVSGEGEKNPADNNAPTFTSPARAAVAENSTAVLTVTATDADDGFDLVTGYALVGGADRSKFTLAVTPSDFGLDRPATAVLTFATAPDFERPTDAGEDNDYVVVVRATSRLRENLPDQLGARELSAEQTLIATVTDVTEPPGAPGAPTFGTPTSDRLALMWPAPANTGPAVTDYDVRYRVAAGPPEDWTEVTDTTITAPSANLDGLDAATTYAVQVRATSDEGTGDWSPSGEGTTAPNSPATGTMRLDDTTPRFGETLTASLSNDVADSDGLPAPLTPTWQWLRVDGTTETAIAIATSSSYTPVTDDLGKLLKARAGFTDRAGNAETLTSAATDAVAKGEQDLTGFAYSPATVKFGDPVPTLRAPSGAVTALAYTATPSDVCTVTATTGMLALAGVGACTVTVTAPPSNDYHEGTATFTVTVRAVDTLALTLDTIAGDDTVNIAEQADGFSITGTTGTEADVTVSVTVGTETLPATSAADGAWSVAVPTAASYISGTGVAVTVRATKTGYTAPADATRRLTIDLSAPTAPTYTAPAALRVGAAIAAMAPAGGLDIDEYSITALPPGLGIDPTDGVISGTPTRANANSAAVTLTVTDTAGNSATVDLTFPAVAKGEQTLTGFAYRPATLTFGADPPALTAPAGAVTALTYSTATPDVCTVDAGTGVLTLVGGVGACTVTVTAPPSNDYHEGTATFTVTVRAVDTLELTLDTIAGDDTVNITEQADGFSIRGTTGTEAGVTVSVTVGTATADRDLGQPPAPGRCPCRPMRPTSAAPAWP